MSNDALVCACFSDAICFCTSPQKSAITAAPQTDVAISPTVKQVRQTYTHLLRWRRVETRLSTSDVDDMLHKSECGEKFYCGDQKAIQNVPAKCEVLTY